VSGQTRRAGEHERLAQEALVTFSSTLGRSALRALISATAVAHLPLEAVSSLRESEIACRSARFLSD